MSVLDPGEERDRQWDSLVIHLTASSFLRDEINLTVLSGPTQPSQTQLQTSSVVAESLTGPHI